MGLVSSMRLSLIVITAIFSIAFAVSANAHPHVWVAVKTTVMYDKEGAVAALRHRWIFDELYTAMAIEGLDTNKDGKVDREELAELAKVNIEGLKDFNYFTAAKLREQPLAFGSATDYWMELSGDDQLALPDAGLTPQEPVTSDAAGPLPEKRKTLALEFTLPFRQPAAVHGDPLSFSVADSSFFIWFDFAKKNPISLNGGPQGCTASLSNSLPGYSSMQSLGDAAASPGSNWGAAKTATLTCR